MKSGTWRESFRLPGIQFALAVIFAVTANVNLRAQSPGLAAQPKAYTTEESPWLITPVLSNSPKLGTSGGVVAAYLHQFDPQSSASMFGIGAIYTTTDSTIYGAFANTYFNQDRDQLSIFVGAGEIHNDYKDFLGSGISVQTTDQAKAASVEYLHEVRDDLYFGAQAVGGNYTLWLNGIGGIPIFDNQGISASINTVGAGLIVRYDGRDHNRSPTSGAYVTLSNMLFGKSLGSEASFHTYRLDARYYLSHGGFGNSRGHVLALRWNNQWTYNAPVPLYVSVSLRGYKKGQYLAPHMSSFEMEERYRLSARWRATAYLGIAKLYGGLVDSSARSFFPAGGLGMQWVVKEQEGIVIALDYAFGVDGNYGLYLRLGQAF